MPRVVQPLCIAFAVITLLLVSSDFCVSAEHKAENGGVREFDDVTLNKTVTSVLNSQTTEIDEAFQPQPSSINTLTYHDGSSIDFSSSTGGASTAVFLNLLGKPSTISVPPELFSDGLHAAIQGSRDAGILDNIMFSVIEPINPSGTVIENVELALAQYPNLLGVLGPLGDDEVEELAAYTTEKGLNLTALGPYTRYASSMGWNPNKYFIRAPPKAEIYAMVTHLATVLRIQRVGMMSLTGSAISDGNYNIILNALYDVHQYVPIEFRQSVDDTELDMDAFNAFLEQEPQAVIINAGISPVSSAFVEQFSTNPATAETPLCIGSDVYSLMRDVLKKGLRHNFYFATTNAFATDTEFSYIQEFEADMKAYISGGSSAYFNSYEEVTSSIVSGISVYGWLVGQVLVKTLQDPSAFESRDAFQRSVFDQRQYNIGGDNLIGPFGGVCSSRDFVQDVSCECNQGGHVVNMYHSVDAQTADLELVFTLPRRDCGAANFSLPFYNEAVVLFHEGHESLSLVAQQLQDGSSPVVETQDKSREVLLFTAVSITGDRNITTYAKDNLLDMIVGPLMNAREVAAQLSDVLIVDPVDAYPLPRLDNPLVVYLMPTLDQQVYVLAEVAKAQKSTCAVVLRRSPEFDAISTVIHNAASLYSMDIKIYSLEESEDLAVVAAAMKQQFVMVIGFQLSDVAAARAYLEQHSDAFLSVLYEEFALNYAGITTALADASADVQQRFVTQTNLPSWTDFTEETAASNPVLKAYHTKFKDNSTVSPSSLQAWYTADVVQQMTKSRFNNLAKSMQDSVYFYSTYSYGGVVFGKLDAQKEGAGDVQNYGARGINMISMSHVSDSSVPASFAALGPFSPDMVVVRGSSFNINMALSVCIPIGVVMCVVTGLLLFVCCRQPTECPPPMNPKGPVTLLVCDIQNSAGLWASHPREMLKATEAYQSIVRKLVRELQCYEVKLIGDAFLIASEDPVRIVNLSVAVQRALYEYDWRTTALDAFYIGQGKHAARSAKSPGSEYYCDGSSAESEESVRKLVESEPYCHMWNGPRVRMGIHTGMCEMSANEGNKSVEYHGDTVHVAARTEKCAQGGQILMTQSTWEYLRENELLLSLYADIAVNDAGSRPLRGIALPVQMYEVEAIEEREWRKNLADEAHYPLQQDSLEEDNVALLSAVQHCGECQSEDARRVFRFVAGLLYPLSTTARVAQLTFLMDQWHIPTHVSSPAPMTVEAKWNILLCRFANRTGNMFALQESVALSQQQHQPPAQQPQEFGLWSRSGPSCGGESGGYPCAVWGEEEFCDETGMEAPSEMAVSPRARVPDAGLALLPANESFDIMHPDRSRRGPAAVSGLSPPLDGFSQNVVSFPGDDEDDDEDASAPQSMPFTSESFLAPSLQSGGGPSGTKKNPLRASAAAARDYGLGGSARAANGSQVYPARTRRPSLKRVTLHEKEDVVPQRGAALAPVHSTREVDATPRTKRGSLRSTFSSTSTPAGTASAGTVESPELWVGPPLAPKHLHHTSILQRRYSDLLASSGVPSSDPSTRDASHALHGLKAVEVCEKVTPPCAAREEVYERSHVSTATSDAEAEWENDEAEMVSTGGASSTVDSTYLRKAGPALPQVYLFPSAGTPYATATPTATKVGSTTAEYVPLSSPVTGGGECLGTTSTCFPGLAGTDYSFT